MLPTPGIIPILQRGKLRPRGTDHFLRVTQTSVFCAGLLPVDSEELTFSGALAVNLTEPRFAGSNSQDGKR